ncbi:hypothetical protein VE00_06520 [Pseudogymnoascus sp. WSF 3629]|nr:hypothetical protein VE00_06520 [Pseudogymnoascus sp. WSF 3629]
MAIESWTVALAGATLSLSAIGLGPPFLLVVAYYCPETNIGKFLRYPFSEGTPSARELARVVRHVDETALASQDQAESGAVTAEAAQAQVGPAKLTAQAAQAQVHPAIRTADGVERIIELLEQHFGDGGLTAVV